MNCRAAEPLIYAERDGVLTPAQHAALADHLASCADCRSKQTALHAAMEQFRDEFGAVELPNVDEEWLKLQRKLEPHKAKRPNQRKLAPVLWFSAPLAVAAAVAFAFLATRQMTPTELGEQTVIAHADYVELADPNASPIVYTDQASGWLVVWAESSPDVATGS